MDPIAAPAFTIGFRRAPEHEAMFVGDLTDDLARCATYNGARWDFLALGNEAAGADQAMRADSRAVHDRRAHADQRSGPDETSVHNSKMADADIVFQNQREARIGVQNGIVLHIDTLANMQGLRIAAQDGSEPDAGLGFHADAADQCGRRCDETIGIDLWLMIFQLIEHRHSFPVLKIGLFPQSLKPAVAVSHGGRAMILRGKSLEPRRVDYNSS